MSYGCRVYRNVNVISELEAAPKVAMKLDFYIGDQPGLGALGRCCVACKETYVAICATLVGCATSLGESTLQFIQCEASIMSAE